ncbi:TPA_asm: protein 4 [Pinus banksiana virus 1]|uniref:Protein 4 n=1 Tax=Pinus banksiana virus 1 TaxID=2977980 RepID=A0A9N7AB40_9RHAB|nr:TPA_asm: protein 4 [Pinus banksiana virus 1]
MESFFPSINHRQEFLIREVATISVILRNRRGSFSHLTNSNRSLLQKKLETFLEIIGCHSMYRCTRCGIGRTSSECQVRHSLFPRGNWLDPDIYQGSDGRIYAHCGIFFDSERLRLILNAVRVSRVLEENTFLGVCPRLDPADALCIYCTERMVIHDHPYQDFSGAVIESERLIIH